jgi:hypothetical protein
MRAKEKIACLKAFQNTQNKQNTEKGLRKNCCAYGYI